jgi:hypothetical protein
MLFFLLLVIFTKSGLKKRFLFYQDNYSCSLLIFVRVLTTEETEFKLNKSSFKHLFMSSFRNDHLKVVAKEVLQLMSMTKDI